MKKRKKRKLAPKKSIWEEAKDLALVAGALAFPAVVAGLIVAHAVNNLAEQVTNVYVQLKVMNLLRADAVASREVQPSLPEWPIVPQRSWGELKDGCQ